MDIQNFHVKKEYLLSACYRRDKIEKYCSHSSDLSDVDGDTVISNIHDLFIDVYVNLVLKKIFTELRYIHCAGCEFVDRCGLKGHPSQHRHTCLMNSYSENVEKFFNFALDVPKYQLADEFVSRLKLFRHFYSEYL